MSAALTGLNQIPGVLGSAIFSVGDECVVHMMPPPFEAALLTKVMAELRNTLNVLNYLDDTGTWTATIIRFDAGYLVMRNVNGMTVMVIAQPTLNPAMLAVGFNVAALKLEKEGLPLPAPLPPPPLPPPGARANSAQMQSVSQSQPISAISQSGNISTSQTGRAGVNAISQSSPRLASASGVSSSMKGDSMGSGDSGVPDAIGKDIMDKLLRALARHIGPFAKLMIKEELNKMGMTATTLGLAQYDDFINMLGRRLQDPNKRREFITEAESLPKR